MNNVDEKENLELNAESAKGKKEAESDKIQRTIAGLAILVSLLGATLTLSEKYDKEHDHTEKECIFAKVLPEEAAINHQKRAMMSDYASKGIIADIQYTEFDGNEPVREVYAPYGVIAQIGNELITDEEGRQCWVAYEYAEPIKNVVDGKVNYILPEGYTLGKDRNGNIVGIKKSIIGFASQSFENDENYKIVNGIVYIKISEEESIAIDGYGFRSSYIEYKEDGTIEEKSEYLSLKK